jgi:hypothetical protein
MQEEKFISWDKDKAYSLVSGGLIYTLLRKLGFYTEGKLGFMQRALLFALMGWLPLLILSLFDGTFSGEDGQLAFVNDFLLHIRLLLVVPFLIWIEKLIDPAFDGYMNSIRRLIPVEDEKKFRDVVIRTDKLSNSWIPEILFLVIIYGLYFINWENLDLLGSRWRITDSSSNINPTSIYYIFISLPLYQFLLARWLWRWIVWVFTVLKFSQLNLRIEASHADQMAGLEFLSLVPMSFCLMCLALSSIFSAIIGEEIVYHGATLVTYVYTIIIFVITIPVIIHLPLLAFIPMLFRTRARAINRFGSLIQYHNHLYQQKWMEGKMPDKESILPSMDNSSMADINGSYQQAVKGMILIPINRNSMIYIILLLLIPFTPLILTMYSFSDLISKLVSIVSG